MDAIADTVDDNCCAVPFTGRFLMVDRETISVYDDRAGDYAKLLNKHPVAVSRWVADAVDEQGHRLPLFRQRAVDHLVFVDHVLAIDS